MENFFDWTTLVTMKDFNEKNDYLRGYYPEVTPLEFYSDIFPAGDIEGVDDVRLRHAEGKPNPIVSLKRFRYNPDGTPLMKTMHTKNGDVPYHAYFMDNRIMFNDYAVVKQACQQDFAVCGLYTSWGKDKSSKHAFSLYGFCIDLDGVKVKQLDSLFYFAEAKVIPVPTYVVNSGHGVHVYYIFERPVPLIPAYRPTLERMKKGLTYLIWNGETSLYGSKDMQFQGIYQSFRMVGSHTKFGVGKKKTKYVLRAFKTGKKVDLTYLNRFLEADSVTAVYAVRNLKKDFASLSDEHVTLDEAKEKWPEWYHRKIELGLETGRYTCGIGLYKWWLKQIRENPKVREGFRFYIVSILFVYAYKCGVPYEQVEQDAIDLIPFLNNLTHSEENDFTIDDVVCASQMYDEKWLHMPWKFIKEKSGLDNIAPKTIHKGRTQKEHLKIARFARTLSSYENNGRPSEQNKVVEWKKAHPDGKKADCIRDTGLSKPTVYKWWNQGDVV